MIVKRTCGALFILVAAATATLPAQAQNNRLWRAHDMDRPKPTVVTPAEIPAPVPPPSDAIVLFDGNNLDAWQSIGGGDAQWKVENGYFEVVGGTRDIMTRQAFGDVQLHVEWSAPTEIRAGGQGRGNSGVLLMGQFELQVLDSYQNDTYADGQAAALYGQYPPLVNAMRPPGEWQAYDIVFTRPRFDRKGDLVTPAYVTAFHNGVLVQNHSELWGETNWLQYLEYRVQPDKLPLVLQDHGNPVRYRNIWVRPLSEEMTPAPPADTKPVFAMDRNQLEQYVGIYDRPSPRAKPYEVKRDSTILQVKISENWHQLVPRSATMFDLRWTDAHVEFVLDDAGVPSSLIFVMGGGRMPGDRRRDASDNDD